MRVKVFITPKAGILDPQGKAVEHSLKSLGFGAVEQARVGRYVVLDLALSSEQEARAQVQRMCEQLLANSVIEDFRFEVEGA